MEQQNIENVGIRRLIMSIGSDVKHKQTVTCAADKEGSSFGSYFVLHDSSGGNHVIYFDDVTHTDPDDYLVPTIPSTGWTAHRIAIAENASATVKAAAIKTALDLLTGKFTTTATGKVVTIEDKAAGFVMPARDAIPTLKKTGFGFQVLVQGIAKTPVGALSEEIGLSGMTSTTKDLLTHATGETVQAKITTGFGSPELSFNMLETDDASFQRVMLYIGGSVMLPEFEDADTVVGWGTQTMGGAKPQFQINLHPADADEADTKGDFTIWKADFAVDNITWNPTEFQTMPIKATIYPDTSKPAGAQFWAKGDTSWTTHI